MGPTRGAEFAKLSTATFTVLEQYPFSVEPIRINDISVLGTVLGGRLQSVSEIKPQAGRRRAAEKS